MSTLRIAVTGATGNVGSSVLEALRQSPEVGSIVGIARRIPNVTIAKVEWRSADVRTDDLTTHLAGCDAVVHLAWMIQPSRDLGLTRETNVEGSRRVFEAAAEAGVGKLVYASSVGAYSPGPSQRLVDESHPTRGIETSFYSRHKAEVERILDQIEESHPGLPVVRLRPGLIFKAEAASEIRRLFLGPLFPNPLLPRKTPVVPDIPGLRFQAVHSDDVASAYLQSVLGSARGAFNIAADPVLDASVFAEALGARRVPIPSRPLRAIAGVTWKLRMQPTPPGWLDMALQSPLMDTTKARKELGWRPRRDSLETLAELLDGLRSGEGGDTPPLKAAAGGRLRFREFLTGVGARNPSS
jgi:UDP-glucose 4-epimerase